MSPEEMDILRRAPLTLTLVSGNTRMIAIARQMERDGKVQVSFADGRAAGDPATVTVMITMAGAEAYARQVAG